MLPLRSQTRCHRFKRLFSPLDLHYSLLSPLPSSALLPRIQCHARHVFVSCLLICCLNCNIRSVKVRVCYFSSFVWNSVLVEEREVRKEGGKKEGGRWRG